jgi:hypothetical protein
MTWIGRIRACHKDQARRQSALATIKNARRGEETGGRLKPPRKMRATGNFL